MNDRRILTKNESQRTVRTMDTEVVPVFNDATRHYRDIMGVPTERADLNSMPAPVRWFGYFFYAATAVFGILLIVLMLQG